MLNPRDVCLKALTRGLSLVESPASFKEIAADASHTVVVTQTVQEALAANLQAHETETEWDTATEVMIDLADGATSTSGTGGVVDGDTVTLTQPGTYRLSGTLSDGQVVK